MQGGDAELLPSLRAGRPSAFAALTRQNNQRLFRLARGILRDDAEAEDAVQEGYVRAFTRLDGFKGEASLATWLARNVANEALGRLRRRRPTVDIDDVAETLVAGDGAAGFGTAEPSPEQASARQEIRRAIETAVDQLPVAFRSVFMLRAIEQMSIDETAACLGIAGETVKTRFHRANKLLRLALTRQFGAVFDGAFPSWDRAATALSSEFSNASACRPRRALRRRREIGRCRRVDGAVCILSLAAKAGVAAAARSEEQIKEADKVTQVEAHYQNHPNGQQRCEICLQFKPPYTCKIVHGPVVRTGWCQFFAARENAH